MELFIRDPRLPELIAHPSTLGAVHALQALHQLGFCPNMVVDIGCGSGILSLLALQLWPEACVIASDISQQAIEDTKENISSAGFSARLSLLRSDTPQALARDDGYDLVIANVLAEYLLHHANTMQSLVSDNGRAVFSGLQIWEQEAVEQALSLQKLSISARLQQGSWCTLIVDKKSI